MAQVGNIETLGNLYVITAPSIAKEEEYEKKQAEKRRKMQVGYVAMELEKRNSNEFFSEYEEVKSQSFDEKKQEIIGLLKKAGIHPKDFPFAVKKDKEGNEIGFVTKGKNEEEIKENIKKFKMELQKSIEKGKITQEEFEKLNAHLEVIMEENKVKLEEEEEEKENQEDFEITNDEIEENLETFIIHNFGNEMAFEDFCKSYNETEDLDKRKFCLQDINSKINRQLGIFGDLQFFQNSNMKFENSFTDDGYYLTEEEVKNKDLKPILYTMMEKSMMREIEIKNKQKISDQKKKEMHDKIMRDKIMKERERKDKKYKEKEANKTKQRVRNAYGN